MSALTELTSTDVRELKASMTGNVLVPGDDGYDEHRRVWNHSIDRRPALVARCVDVGDVIAAVHFARERGLLTAVRGGGHSFPGFSTCDDGIVIDLGSMRGIQMDLDHRTVTAQAGALLGDLDSETQPHGLAVPSGVVTHTGIAGLTLGGGIGWQQRKYGLTIDNLRSVEMVTADGGVVTASEEDNSDLFWGVRGGGGNFGLVTSFEFGMNAIGPTLMAGPVFWPISDASEVFRFYRDWVTEAPDELMTIVVQRKAPAVPGVPPDVVGRPVIAVAACYSGPIEEAERVMRPLKSFRSPILDLCHPKPFIEHQRMFDPSFPHGWHYYIRSCDVAGLEDEVIDISVEHGSRIESSRSSVAIWQMGGAMARVADDATAFNGRGAGFTFNINGNTETDSGFEQEREWVRAFWSALGPHHTSVYVNFLMEEGSDRVRDAYGAAKYGRLKALKRKYDPGNFFRLNQNITPD